jgi:hypothetical protein
MSVTRVILQPDRIDDLAAMSQQLRYNNWTSIPRTGDTIWLNDGDYEVVNVIWNPGADPVVYISLKFIAQADSRITTQ